jgi:hypothetical protein
MTRTILPAIAFAAFLLASDKGAKPAEAHYRNDEIELTARLYNEKAAIADLVGSDMGGFIVVVEVRVAPKTENPLTVDKDDFFLRSDKDGQRSQPYSPSQIAGKGALVVSETTGRGAMMGNDRGPVWGGMGGGQPGRMPGSGGGMGNAPGEKQTEATMKSSAGDKDSELLAVLKKKALREGQTDKPVTGLLYFPLEGKHKVKDLELTYKGPAGKFSMRFRQ